MLVRSVSEVRDYELKVQDGESLAQTRWGWKGETRCTQGYQNVCPIIRVFCVVNLFMEIEIPSLYSYFFWGKIRDTDFRTNCT